MELATKFQLDQLVEAFLRGDDTALPEIVKILNGPMYSFLRKQLPEVVAFDLEADLLQELFDNKIWKYRPREGKHFWSWWCTVMHNAAEDWRRAHPEALEPFNPKAPPEDPRAQFEFLCTELHPLSPERLDLIEALRKAFALLSEADRDILRLRLVAEMEYSKIAELERPNAPDEERKRLVNALKVRFHRAQNRIVELMKADDRVPASLFETME